jgi:ubiquinone/menaquinone biosynthesis C-methylase UbiE
VKVTDYSQIANKYDKNEYRHKIEYDAILSTFIEEKTSPQYDILDLACGTGIYLQNQMEFFKDKNINWYGLDASRDMLEKAREKIVGASFVDGVAENMPFEPNKFDFIVNNYAFHHFTQKAEALDEITRVLKVGGIFEMHNIAIHQMKDWWVYKYFPSAYFEDLKRCWDKDLIFYELTNRGFEVELNIKYQMQHTKVVDLLEHAKNRDISVLTLIDENQYIKGLEALTSDVYNNPEGKIVCDFAELFCSAKKLYNLKS